MKKTDEEQLAEAKRLEHYFMHGTLAQKEGDDIRIALLEAGAEKVSDTLDKLQERVAQLTAVIEATQRDPELYADEYLFAIKLRDDVNEFIVALGGES